MWNKQGILFKLEPCAGRSTHTQVPTPYVMNDRIRIFYSCRNKGKSFIAYFDASRDLEAILHIHEKPIVELGKPGMFDADGMMPSCVVPMGEELLMYYIGWNALAGDARYQNEIGILVSRDDGDTWERKFQGPVMGRSPTEPGLAVMPFVLHHGVYRMWYQSLTKWVKVGDQFEPVYVVKYAESIHGIKWERYPQQCIVPTHPHEAFSRPSVILQDGVYRMWMCVRDSRDYRGGKGSYKIEYAASDDAVSFHRFAGEDLYLGNAGEFDSDMQCYPAVFEIDGRMVMLYNGNGFGQSGIGYATWIS